MEKTIYRIKNLIIVHFKFNKNLESIKLTIKNQKSTQVQPRLQEVGPGALPGTLCDFEDFGEGQLGDVQELQDRTDDHEDGFRGQDQEAGQGGCRQIPDPVERVSA